MIDRWADPASRRADLRDDRLPGAGHVRDRGLGHDVHLVRLDAGTDLETLGRWMNWIDPIGLIGLTPGGFQFMDRRVTGGLEEPAVQPIQPFPVDLVSVPERVPSGLLPPDVPTPEEPGSFLPPE